MVQEQKWDMSKSLYERARRVAPGGVHSYSRGVPYYQPPIYFARGEGSKLYDVDGNQYIDYNLGFGPCIHGHNPRVIIEAIKSELEKGWLYTGESDINVELAEKFCSLVPCADQVLFDTDGSKAVMYAIRFARAFTGREKFIRFEGVYHGVYDDIVLSQHPPIEAVGLEIMPNKIPAHVGIPSNTGENVIVQSFNNEDALERTVRDHAHELACVIMEPMVSTGIMMPKKGYLEFVRKITRENGILLIFDEIVTGFRVAVGGAQQYFDVTPDLATFGKALGAGLPISAIAGRKEVMNTVDEHRMHAGTVNANRVCSAAAKASIEELSKNGGAAIKQLYEVGDGLIKGLRDASEDVDVPMLIQGLGPCFFVYFTDAHEILNWRDMCRKTDSKRLDHFIKGLLRRGVFHHVGGRWVNSTAHTHQDTEKTVEAAYEVLKEISG